MLRRWIIGLCLGLLLIGVEAIPAHAAENAQGDGQDLPTGLYILLNEGRVERVGLGAAGVQPVTPADVFVVDFAVAPDGRWIAYRGADGLYLYDMDDADAEPILLEGQTANFPPLRDGGQTMAWSPLGDALAYTTEYGARVAFNISADATQFTDIAASPLLHLAWSPGGNFLAAEAEANVWWLYRREANTMPLTGALPSAYGADWLDASRLVFAPQEGGLLTIDLANANAQTVLLPAARLYRYPYVRPDGNIAVLSRLPEEPVIGDNGAFYQLIDYTNDVATVIQTSSNDLDISGLSWVPRGELMLAFRGGALSLVLPLEGVGFALPVGNAVAFGWGSVLPVGAEGIAAGNDITFRAPSFGVMQAWRVPADGAPRQQLTQVDFDVIDFAINGQTLTYSSGGSLWVQDLATPDAVPVELARVNETATDLTFSPDGTQLYFVTTNIVDGGLWQVPVALTSEGELNAPTLILPNSEGTTVRWPAFAPNVNALLIHLVNERTEIAIFDPVSEAILTIGTYDRASWLADGRILAWDNNDGAALALIDSSVDPINVLPLWNQADLRLVDAVQFDPGTFWAVVQQRAPVGPSRATLGFVPITGGNFTPLADLGFLRNGRLSADGTQVVGIGGDSDQLMVVTDGAPTILQRPNGVTGVRWE